MVIASSLYTILAYKSFHRNAVLSDSRVEEPVCINTHTLFFCKVVLMIIIDVSIFIGASG